VVSHGNDAWLRDQLPRYLILPQVLHALRVTEDPAAVTLLLEEAAGARFTVPFAGSRTTSSFVDVTAAGGATPPLFRQRARESYWLTQLEGTRTLYLQYNRCQGGSSSVDDALISGLQARSTWRTRGRLFALTGGRTFSSGLWTAIDLLKSGAILVGEPTGGTPNHYGQVSTFSLPHSHLLVGYSTRYYRLMPESDTPSLMPELLVEPTIDDLRRGHDPVLEAATSWSGR
jgi:hypothetical protein